MGVYLPIVVALAGDSSRTTRKEFTNIPGTDDLRGMECGLSRRTHVRAPNLRKQLAAMSQSEIVDLVMQLCKLARDNEAFVRQHLGDATGVDQALERAKATVRKQLWPDRGLPKLKLNEAKKAISQFQKISRHPSATLELMLYYVELGVKCTREYGDMYGEFYSSMITMFQEVLGRLLESGDPAVVSKLKSRVEACATGSSGIGWGFGDEMTSLYSQWAADLGETDEV